MQRALTLLALLAATSARAEDPVAPAAALGLPTIVPDFAPFTSPIYVPHVPPLAVPGVDPSTLSPRPIENPFAQATEAGGQASRSFNENFDGDPSPIYYRQTIVTAFQNVTRVVGFSQQVTGFTQQVTVNTQTGVRTITNVPIISNVSMGPSDSLSSSQRKKPPSGRL